MNIYRSRGIKRAVISAVFGAVATVAAAGGAISIAKATQEPDTVVSQRWGTKNMKDPVTGQWGPHETNITETRTSDEAWGKYALGVVFLVGAAASAVYSVNRAQSAGRNFRAAERMEKDEADEARCRQRNDDAPRIASE